METVYEVKGYHLQNSQSDKVIFVCLIRDTNSPMMNGAEAGTFIRAWGRRGQGLQSKIEQGSFVSTLNKCRKYKDEKLQEGYQTVDWIDPQYHIAKTAVLLHPLIRQTWQDKTDYKVPSSLSVPKKTVVYPNAPATEHTVPYDWSADGVQFIEVDE